MKDIADCVCLFIIASLSFTILQSPLIQHRDMISSLSCLIHHTFWFTLFTSHRGRRVIIAPFFGRFPCIDTDTLSTCNPGVLNTLMVASLIGSGFAPDMAKYHWALIRWLLSWFDSKSFFIMTECVTLGPIVIIGGWPSHLAGAYLIGLWLSGCLFCVNINASTT